MRSERSTGIVKALCNCVPHCGNVLFFFLSWIVIMWMFILFCFLTYPFVLNIQIGAVVLKSHLYLLFKC